MSVLLDLAKKEAKLDEDKGADVRSPLLQALVQVSPASRPRWLVVSERARGASIELVVFVWRAVLVTSKGISTLASAFYDRIVFVRDLESCICRLDQCLGGAVWRVVVFING